MAVSRGPTGLQLCEIVTDIKTVESVHIGSSTVRFSYTWKIDLSTARNADLLISPVFSDKNSKSNWALILLYPSGIDSVNQIDFVSIFLYRVHCNSLQSEVKALFRFCTVDADGNQYNHTSEMQEPCVFKQQDSWGYRKWFLDLEDTPYDIRLEDELNIFCEVILNVDNVGIMKNYTAVPLKVPPSQLVKDIGILFESQKLTDFTISNEGNDFPVHRAILAARSPVFLAMFEHDTKEQKENRVEMTNITPDALKEMLRYIYTDKVVDLQEVAFDLLAAAEKYALDGLKILCEDQLCKSVKVENAAEILIHADLHRADELKKQVIRFINDHTIDVMDTEAFKSMVTSHPYLVAEILRATGEKKMEVKVNPTYRSRSYA